MSKNALITGASKGIGKAIAEEFARNGYSLNLTGYSHGAELTAYCKELEAKYGIKAVPYICDIGNYNDVCDIFKNIQELDVLVNNAGIAWLGLLTDMTDDEWHRLMSTNLDSLFNTCKNAVPIMLKKHSGRIINITSVWGNVGASCEVAYSASKGAVNSFTRALAKELAPSNIAVNAIACGVIDTDMNRSHLSEEDIEALKEEIPANRLGSPEEVARLAYHISESPAYMTGQIITIDGGWY
ncbi:MAG: SDR family NAD(P)-dependent oxidoreductase [Butyrivibrio sp.]|nr:SDR family NAD(P)-dependent oxidoreductase [Butyrivibrio sp.]